MDGPEIFKFAVRRMGESAISAVERAGLKRKAIDYLIPHQANVCIMEASRERLQISDDKMIQTIQHYGNTSSASIPLVLADSVKNGRFREDGVLVMVGFGGFALAALTRRWGC